MYCSDLFQRVKAAARGNWPTILANCGIPSEVLDGKNRPCPKPGCGGTDRFRFMNQGEDGAIICNKCGTGIGDGIGALAWWRNCSAPEAANHLAIQLGLAAAESSSPAANMDVDASQNASDVIVQVALAKGIPSVDALRRYGAAARMRGHVVVCQLPMWNANGCCGRFDISPNQSGGSLFKGMTVKGDKLGLFLPGNKVDGTTKWQCRLPKPDEQWLLVEGVKDAATLSHLGYLCAGMPTNKLNKQLVELLRDCHVIIVPDLDKAGIDGARETANRLLPIAASVRIAMLPGDLKKSGGDDVRDVLRRDGEVAVREAIRGARLYEVATETAVSPATSDDKNEAPDLPAEDQTDISNAERFVAEHGEVVRYIGPWDKWIVYRDSRWVVDDSRAVELLAQRTADNLWEEYRESAAGEGREDVRAFLRRSSNISGLTGMTRASSPRCAMSHDLLDNHPLMFNCQNGTLDLVKGELRPHSRDDYLTQLSPVIYDPAADCPRFLRFLHHVMDDQSELVDFLQELVGYWLSGLTADHVLPVFFGGGANGKTVFIETIFSLLGNDYAMKAPPGMLMSRRHEAHPTERASLFRKRLVAEVETSEGGRLNEALVKELTGGERLTARRMREDFWGFEPTQKLVMITNHKPAIRGTDEGIWRRMLFVPWMVTIPPERQDPLLLGQLQKELPGILNWALLGFQRWYQNGLRLNRPQAVVAATDSYRSESDSIAQFLQECCLQEAGAYVGASELFHAYQNWGGHISQTLFGRLMGERGVEKRTVQGRKRYSGIRLMAGAEDDQAAG